jgi:hypothetical protein
MNMDVARMKGSIFLVGVSNVFEESGMLRLHQKVNLKALDFPALEINIIAGYGNPVQD